MAEVVPDFLVCPRLSVIRKNTELTFFCCDVHVLPVQVTYR